MIKEFSFRFDDLSVKTRAQFGYSNLTNKPFHSENDIPGQIPLKLIIPTCPMKMYRSISNIVQLLWVFDSFRIKSFIDCNNGFLFA